MKKTSLLLLVVPLILATCNKGPTPDPEAHDEDGVEYDDEGLYQANATLSKLLVAKSGLVVIAGLNEDFRHNAMRMIYMHSPETEYVLLK